MNQGARETSIKDILTVLTERFPQSDVQPVEQALESIQDIASFNRAASHSSQDTQP